MKNQKKVILTIVGSVLAAICLFKFSVIGIYQSEIPFYFVLLAVGAVLLFIASKMPSRVESAVTPPADRS